MVFLFSIGGATAHAGSWVPGSGDYLAVTMTASGTDGNLVWTSPGLGTTEGCADSTHGRIDDASPNLQRLLALAVTALASGMRLQMYVSGCLSSGGVTVPKITDIRVVR